MFGHLRSHPDRKPRAPPSPGGPQAAPAGDPAAENGGTSGDTRGMEVSKENGMVSAGEAAAILRSDITAPGGQSSVAARPCRKKRRVMQRTGQEELNGGGVGRKGNPCLRDESRMEDAAATLPHFRSGFTASSTAAAEGHSFEAAPPCGRKRMKMPKTGRPELNRDDGGEEGNYCQQGVTSEIEASCCRGKRRKAGGSGTGSNDEETSEGRCVHKCTICGSVFPSGQALGGHKCKHWKGQNSAAVPTAAARVPGNVQPVPWGRAMDIDLNRLAPRGRAMDTDLNRPPPRGRAMDIDLNRLPPSEDDSGNVPGTIHETTL
ncbi:unnamed protein product [Spirodela intermedia]|uniref:C2H2-type domain-containing protein n=1 Tax=Spirodela intermedia TaxID=51605 RepID=A0A7I8LF42_SPIIN|nr:unnamed protein product [Spirodela intermedia]